MNTYPHQGPGGYYPQGSYPQGGHSQQQQYPHHPQHGYGGHPNMNSQQQQQLPPRNMPPHGGPAQGRHQSQQQPQTKPIWKPSAYEAKQLDTWFYHIDDERTGVIKGAQAVNFLKKSNLPRDKLRTIWALVDMQNRGFIDKNQFYVVMRLVSICHNIPDIGEVTMESYYRTVRADFKMPPMVESDAAPPEAKKSPSATKNVELNSPKPSPLPDPHLSGPPPPVLQTGGGHPPPQRQILPQHLPHHHPPPLRGQPHMQMGSPIGDPVPPLPPAHLYTMTKDEFDKYEGLFKTYDKDGDGFLSEPEIFPIFMKSGVDQQLQHQPLQEPNTQPSVQGMTLSGPLPTSMDMDDDFDDFQGPMSDMPSDFDFSSSSVVHDHVLGPPAGNISNGSLNTMEKLDGMTHESTTSQHLVEDFEFDDFQEASMSHDAPLPESVGNNVSNEGQENVAAQVLSDKASSEIAKPMTPKRKSIEDILSTVSDDPLNLRASKLYADPAQLAHEEKKKESFVGKTAAMTIPHELPPSSQRMSVFDEMAEMDLQASNEEWDDFADETTAPVTTEENSAGEQQPQEKLSNNISEDEFGDFDSANVSLDNSAQIITKDQQNLEDKILSSSAFDDAFGEIVNEDNLIDENEDFGAFNHCVSNFDGTTTKRDECDEFSKAAENEVNDFGEFTAANEMTVNDFSDATGKDDDFGDFSSTTAITTSAFGDFANTSSENTDDFGDFSNATVDKSDKFGDLPSTITNDDDFGDFTSTSPEMTNDFGGTNNTIAEKNEDTSAGGSNVSVSDVDDFGDFTNTTADNTDDFGDFTDTIAGSMDNFGDVSTGAVDKAGDFGDFNNANGDKVDDFGNFNEKAQQISDFGDFSTAEDDFGDFSNKIEDNTKEDDCGDFSNMIEENTKEDDFGDFSNATDKRDDFGDFSNSIAVENVDFGSFNTLDNGKVDDFGGFPATDVDRSHGFDENKNVDCPRTEDVALSDKKKNQVDESVDQSKNNAEGNVDDVNGDVLNQSFIPDSPDTRMGNATLDFSLDDMDDPFADIAQRFESPALEFSLLDLEIPSTSSSVQQETFDLNSLLSSQTMTPPSETTVLASITNSTATSNVENVDDSLLLLDFPALPTTSNFSTLPDPVDRNLNFDELEHLATVLSELGCTVEAYGAKCQALSVKRIRELSSQKMEAVENDDLELAIQLRDTINQEREEGASRSDEKAWLNIASAGIETVKNGGAVAEPISIDKLVATVSKLDAACGKQAKMKFLALRPSPDEVDKAECLHFSVNAQRCLQLAIAVRSTHKLYVKYWQLILSRVQVLLNDAVQSLEAFKAMPTAMQNTVLDEAGGDGGKFNTFVRGILQVAEVGSWVAVSCHEAMIATAPATKTLSLCEVVVRLVGGLRKMSNVATPVVSLEELTKRSDRMLSREEVTFCNITLRPIIVAPLGSDNSTMTKKKSNSKANGLTVLYKSVPYLQGAVNLWLNQIKGDGPPSNRVSPFV